ncbi:hypothetical protein Forpe1208_v017135 [Fusarium oxysporum f. sp. rapae]|uniref:Uncharacterized protein n=1 Tax=Fusarium oxysporum f. sp. rapae TaxID=485398 RepID=A0A8J5TWV5_FUSOX|nr:hypothetical protein Forpe1208_v017135 [Fusarium oxysporum f. sp. rapae]
MARPDKPPTTTSRDGRMSLIDDGATIENVRERFQDQGYFFQEIERVGALVKGLYDQRRLRSEDVVYENFEPFLQSNPLLAKLLEGYSVKPNVTWPWGTYSKYYCWDDGSLTLETSITSIIIYMLAPLSHPICCAGSHHRKPEKLLRDPYGAFSLSDESMALYEDRSTKTEIGGV